jgi:hypothetical protein
MYIPVFVSMLKSHEVGLSCNIGFSLILKEKGLTKHQPNLWRCQWFPSPVRGKFVKAFQAAFYPFKLEALSLFKFDIFHYKVCVYAIEFLAVSHIDYHKMTMIQMGHQEHIGATCQY